MADVLTYPIRSDKYTMSVAVRLRLCDHQSQFQRIEVVDTDAFGRILLLDGHVQLAELDEMAYHEALVHIPLFAVENPKRALVIGGGDGGVLREIARHPSIETIDMVDIDADVIEKSKRYLPSVSAGAFDDPRVNLFIEDAFGFVKLVAQPYDLIVLDITDTYEDEEGELSENLFTDAFYADCFAALSDGGILVTQADNHIFCPYSLKEVVANLGRFFPKLGAFQALVPSFGGYSAYVWASRGAAPPRALPDARAKALDLRYLNTTTYALAFQNLPFGDVPNLGEFDVV